MLAFIPAHRVAPYGFKSDSLVMTKPQIRDSNPEFILRNNIMVPPCQIVPPSGQKAAAVQEYARRAKDLTLEHTIAKARIWFERRCGKLLRDMELDKGGDSRRYNGATSVDRPQTLKDMGLSKYQSSRFQRIFDVPENEFIDELAKLDRTSKTTISSWVRCGICRTVVF